MFNTHFYPLEVCKEVLVLKALEKISDAGLRSEAKRSQLAHFDTLLDTLSDRLVDTLGQSLLDTLLYTILDTILDLLLDRH